MPGHPSSKLIQEPVVLVNGQTRLAQDLVEQTPPNLAGAMVGDDNDSPVSASKDVVTPIATDPSKADGFDDIL
jgi:hypothetical protein